MIKILILLAVIFITGCTTSYKVCPNNAVEEEYCTIEVPSTTNTTHSFIGGGGITVSTTSTN